MEQCRIHRTLLALPDYVFPAVMLVLGRPTQQQKARPKPGRCGLKHIVHENGYRRMDTGEHSADAGLERGGAALCRLAAGLL